MAYREKISKLAAKANELTQQTGEDDLTFICGQLDRISSYHNHVIEMEQQMDFQKFRLDGDEFRAWLEDQNARRIQYHKSMIDSVIILNRYSRINGLEPLYEGKVNEKLKYDDADTRFGIAAFADEYCSEIFHAGQSQHVNQLHKQRLQERDLPEIVAQTDGIELQR